MCLRMCLCSVCMYDYIKVENDGAMPGSCYIRIPSQLIALVPATSPWLHIDVRYTNDSLSC